MERARIIVGANYGDEGKGTVTAHYAKQSGSVLNILTNGGSQRGHSIVSGHGSHTFQHFGSGTYYGAASYYSRFYILNPMQFAKEYAELAVKPSAVYRHPECRWSTPHDMMANAIIESLAGRKASCGMGIWNTIRRHRDTETVGFDRFCGMDLSEKLGYIDSVRHYYENMLDIPTSWLGVWRSHDLKLHFIDDCDFMLANTAVLGCRELADRHTDLIFENGQGLLLCDTGKDTPDTTPSDTGVAYSLAILGDMGVADKSSVTVHYVTRPYLTRHGDGCMEDESARAFLSSGVMADRTNGWNRFQGDFRYGRLDIGRLMERVVGNAGSLPFVVELTHCDEMDRVSEFRNVFGNDVLVNTYDSPEI